MTAPEQVPSAPGTVVIRNLPFEEYCASPALNASLAKIMLTSPGHFKAALTAEREPSMAMLMGSMIHAWALTGEVPQYVVRPEMDPEDSTKPWNGNRLTCKKWKREHEAAGRLVLTPDESQREIRMCEALANSKEVCEIFEAHPERELSIFATWQGVPIKARLDLCSLVGIGSIPDLKKARAASPRGFGNQAATLDYPFSAVWYQRILALALGTKEPPPFQWIVVEDSDAAPTPIYPLTESQQQLGIFRMDQAIALFKQCTKAGEWPFEGTAAWPAWRGHRTMVLPRWYEVESTTEHW